MRQVKRRSLITNKVLSKDSDQTGPIPSLIGVFAGRTCHFVGLPCCISIISLLWSSGKTFLLFILFYFILFYLSIYFFFFFLWAPPSPSHSRYQAKTTFFKFKLKFNNKFSLCNFVYIHTYIHTFMYVYENVHTCANIYARICTPIHTYIHTYDYAWSCHPVTISLLR